MTQSGQGDEQQLPAVRHAHEGVVLPAEGGAPWTVRGQAGEQAVPAGGQPWGGPWGPDAGQPDDRAQGQYQQPGSYAPQPGQYPQPHHPQPPPPGQQPAQGHQAPQPQQPYPGQQAPQPYQGQQAQQPYPGQPFAQPLPPEAVPGTPTGGDADATQYIAAIPGGPAPVMPAPGGPLPEQAADSTQFLGRHSDTGQPADADATQYIPPVPGGAPYGIRPGPPGERQPPAEFDNLFRSEGPAGATQQMPHLDHAQPHQFQPHQPPHQQHPSQPQQPQQPQQGPQGGRYGQEPPRAPETFPTGLQGLRSGHEQPDRGDGPPRKRSSHIPLIAAVVVGCAVIGLGAGALMSGEDSGKDDKQRVASESSQSAVADKKGAADPAEPQAKELDKLLADSNDSRSAVISAVEKIKSCQALDQAATDLKGAAQQRRDLVTRLEAITVDQLPDHEALTSSLTKAWKASAEADDHYAAWAGQAKNNKKVCKGGKARSTDETSKANASSGEASKAKRQASGIWNSIAVKYGLTERAPTQL